VTGGNETMDEVKISTQGRVGLLSLNRSKAIHALTHGMCIEMSEALAAWEADPMIAAVLIDHTEGRGFCSGGDIGLLRKSAMEDGGASGRLFFFDEYQLNHKLFTYPKPTVAFMDGITMGGGVGISAPCRYRVVTENTRFAMPETGIGLFPDVGGGWYLSRLARRLGQYLALTGARLDGADCLWAGIGTHFLQSEKLREAKERIARHPDRIDGILAELSLPSATSQIAGEADRINRLFAGDTLEEILQSLESDASDWSNRQLAILNSKSPLACKVALRLLEASAALDDFAANMTMEYRLACRLLTRTDFAEGVRALIIDKTNDPVWSPSVPADVGEELLDELFSPLPTSQEWIAQ
jgi:enoyl-CoA hydratase